MAYRNHPQCGQHLPDGYRPYYFQPQDGSDFVGEAAEDAALCRRPTPAQLLHWQALPQHQCFAALVERVQLTVLAYLQAGAERHYPQAEYETPIVFCKQLPERAKKGEEGARQGERISFALCRYKVIL